MKVTCMASAFRPTFLSAALIATATLAFGAPPVLRWNPTATNLWDATSLTWLDATNGATAWQPGSEAQFTGTGGIVNIAADVVVSNITFSANGYTLLGAGRLAVEGAISVADATTNSIAAEIITSVGISKTGLGALAIARCTGPLSAAAGQLLVSGSLFTDAAISVASGASVVTLGDPDTAANLLLNPGFESPAIGGWGYVGAGTVISNWVVTALANNVGCQNAALNATWNAIGSAPEGNQMLILQYNGAVAQTVTLPADGIYSVAFSHLLRSAYPENQVYVTLDGVLLASFLNRSVQFSPGRFASGALWLKAGSHTLGIGGEGSWNDRATMVDAVCFAPPSTANACRALTGDSILKVVTGATVRLNHSGTVPLAYVSTNGASASGTFNSSHASGIFTGGGALSCAAPANVCTWNGTGLWSDAARWTDGTAPAAGGSQNLLLRFPNGLGNASTNDFSGTFLARRLNVSGAATVGAFTLAGNPIALTNDVSGTAPKISVQAPGAWLVQSPILARSALTLDVFGTLTFSGNPLTLANGSTFYKSGAGAVIMPTLTNTAANAFVYEGLVQTPSLPSSLAVSLLSQSGKASAYYLTQGGTTLNNTLSFMGSGSCTLGTGCGGNTVTLSNWITSYGNAALFDVGAGDTLSLRQMLLAWTSKNNADYSTTALVKTGPGTLEIRSAGSDSDRNRAYQGATTLRNGTLTLSEDDYGTLNGWTNPFNSRTYDGKGGSLGSSSFTNTVSIGDSGTATTNNLALIANGDGRWIGHNIEVFNKGNTVTLGMTTGTVMFAGTTTLHRDITLSGPANGVMVFSNLVAAADFSGPVTPTLSGLAGLRFEGAVPAGLSLALNARQLRFGSSVIRATTLNALALGSAAASATLDIDFGPSTNDTIAVTASGGLTLSNTVVNLTCAGSGLPFAEPGTYKLFTYAGTLGGDTARLSIGNPQSSASYTFSNDTANARVLLTIGNTSGGSSATWKSPVSGSWALGSNWDSGSAPSGAGVTPVFGLAIAAPATVTLGTARTVGGLTFNNSSYGYTLSGGSLTLDNGGQTPIVSVLTGTHTLDTTLNGSSGLSASVGANAMLVLSTNAAVNTGLSLSSGTIELRGNTAVNGATALAASTTLRVNATNAAIGSLSGASAATVALSGAAPKLTVNQTAGGTFAGTLSGASTAWLEKTGAASLALTGPNATFAGTLSVSQGAVALQGASLAGPAAVGTTGELDVQPTATNGLMGNYYSVTPNTNNFWTLAGMESHFATLTPDLAALSGVSSNVFDFNWSTSPGGVQFPQPYGAGGSRALNFEAVWRGTITVPVSGTYVFGYCGDDGAILAIDGQTVIARNYTVGANNWVEGTLWLDAGRYDIVIGYFQLTGNAGLQIRVRTPGTYAAVPLPNAWLTPYSAVGALSGKGALALASSNALLRVTQTGLASFGGALAASAGTLLAKGGGGTLTLGGGGALPNAFGGDIDVQGGILTLATDERIGDASALRVRSGATLTVASAETVGCLAGNGAVVFGSGYVYTNVFSGDADCDISTSKTYTHLLDFPANGSPATVNGVLFTDAGMSGANWAFTGIQPTGAWTNSPFTGMTHLLEDFSYGSTNFTLTLTGLTPGKVYETRLYFRNFNNNTRNLVFDFAAGATSVGSSLYFNPDTVARSIVGCRFVADAAGSLSIHIVSLVFADTCHLYGLSNEEVAGTAVPALTLAPSAGRSSRFLGTLAGKGTLIKQGAGTQAFSGNNALPAPLSVQAGTVTLESGASITAGVALASGATLEAPFGGATLGGLTGQGTFSLGAFPTNAGPYFVNYTNDAGTGISSSKVYTHLLDFGTSTTKATVNGVAFDKQSATYGVINGYGWTNAPPSGNPGGNPANIGVPSSQGIYNLIYDMNYNTATGTLYLTGLTVGKRYELRLYHRCWAAGTDRSTRLVFDPTGTNLTGGAAITFNPDAVAPNDNYLGYRYLAATNALAITIQSLKIDRYHLYGLSNEETYDTLGNPVTLNIAGSGVFDGTVTGPGGWVKAGAGTLTFTGTCTNTGLLAVNAGAFGVAGNGCATRGPVTVATGATLFGNGTVGGAVTVASNAWIQAGTTSACGTLQTGASLSLAPGARIAWRFDTAASDSFTVNGLLTFPTSGTVQASALTAGAHAPGKATLFASTQTINGPADLTGWTVAGVNKASLAYSADRTKIYVRAPRGTLIIVN